MKTNEIDAASSSRSDMLRDVRGFIERGWTQGAFARNAAHEEMPSPQNPDATCWCLSGAAMANVPASAFHSGRLVSINWAAREALATALGFDCVAHMQRWNDEPSRTQAEVLARIDQALERAGGGE